MEALTVTEDAYFICSADKYCIKNSGGGGLMENGSLLRTYNTLSDAAAKKMK